MPRSLKKIWKGIPNHIKYIAALFLASRAVLMAIGALTHVFLLKSMGGFTDFLTHIPYLRMWHVWDSVWYVKIAKEGYVFTAPFDPNVYSTLGFFPLYGYLMKIPVFFIHNYDVAGLIVSNVALLIAAHYLYKLVRLHFDEKTSLRSVLFLFALPTGYVLSGVLSESLFLCLLLVSLYEGRRGKWFKALLAAAFLTITKAFGILIVVPLFMMYLSQSNFKLKNFTLSLLWFLLPLASLGSFFWYCYYLTGDALAYVHLQAGAWKHGNEGPFVTFFTSFDAHLPHDFVNAIAITLILLFFAFLFWRGKLPITYTVLGLILVLFVPASGGLVGSLRYMSFNFPLLLGLSRVTENETAKEISLMSMALLQGVFLVFWTAGNYWFIS